MNNGLEDNRKGKHENPRILSVILTGRDDDYMLDFKYRISTTINYISRNLARINRLDDVEILVTDWGSQPRLSQSLQLSPEAGKICRFINVPDEVIFEVQESKEDFHAVLATNIGIRRSSGNFIMMMGADTLITEYSLETLLNLLCGKVRIPADIEKSYLLLSRFQIPWQYVKRQPSIEEWDRFLFLNTHNLERGEDYVLASVSAGMGALMMHRSLWHQLRGFDERLGKWGWSDVEFGLRTTQYYPWIELSSIGISTFHLGHAPDGRRVSVFKHKKYNPRYHNPVLHVNDQNWGLSDRDLEIQTSGNIQAGEKQSCPINNAKGSEPPKVTPWNQTLPQIIAELKDERIREHVKRIIEMASKDSKKWDITEKDMYPLFLLSWYGLHHYPRQYLEFGIRQCLTSAAVVAASPATEIYGIDRWEGELFQSCPNQIEFFLLDCINRHGYIRFINGDITTGITRLRDSFIGNFSIDLALIRSELLGSEAEIQIKELLTYLTPGGAAIFTFDAPDRFKKFYAGIQNEHPEYTLFRCADGRTGMILAASLKTDSTSETDKADYTINLDIKWKNLLPDPKLIRRFFAALCKPKRYTEYIKRLSQMTTGRNLK